MNSVYCASRISCASLSSEPAMNFSNNAVLLVKINKLERLQYELSRNIETSPAGQTAQRNRQGTRDKREPCLPVHARIMVCRPQSRRGGPIKAALKP